MKPKPAHVVDCGLTLSIFPKMATMFFTIVILLNPPDTFSELSKDCVVGHGPEWSIQTLETGFWNQVIHDDDGDGGGFDFRRSFSDQKFFSVIDLTNFVPSFVCTFMGNVHSGCVYDYQVSDQNSSYINVQHVY